MQDPKPLNYAVLGGGRFFRCPGGEVFDLNAVVYVNDLTVGPHYKFLVALEGGMTSIEVMNLTREAERAEAYRQAFIDAWIRWHSPVKEATTWRRQAFSDPQNQHHGLGDSNVP